MSGAAQYRKGRVGEYSAKSHLERAGWYVTRSYASKGPWDLLALAPDQVPLMVQVKAGDASYMRPSDRVLLLTLAHFAGARAILCHVPHPHSGTWDGIGYVELTSMADRVAFTPDVFGELPQRPRRAV